MKRREFIAAATAVVSVSGGSAFAQTTGAPTSMHPPKYKAVKDTADACVETGEDCLRHCLAMLNGKDTSMAACTTSVIELVATCRALATLAAVNSTFTVAFAKTVATVCDACDKECQKFEAKYIECKACGDACKKCATECRKVA